MVSVEVETHNMVVLTWAVGPRRSVAWRYRTWALEEKTVSSPVSSLTLLSSCLENSEKKINNFYIKPYN